MQFLVTCDEEVEGIDATFPLKLYCRNPDHLKQLLHMVRIPSLMAPNGVVFQQVCIVLLHIVSSNCLELGY